MYDHVQIVAENRIPNRIDIAIGGYQLEGYGKRYRLSMWGPGLFPRTQYTNPSGETYDGIAVTGETYNDLLASVMLLSHDIPPPILRYFMSSVANAIFYAEGAEDIRREKKEE